MKHTELPQTPSANGKESHGQVSTSALTTTPLPASKKVYVKGEQAGVAVPMREIFLSSPKKENGASAGPSVLVYDTSGPYTDPSTESIFKAAFPHYAMIGFWHGKTWKLYPTSLPSTDDCGPMIRLSPPFAFAIFANH